MARSKKIPNAREREDITSATGRRSSMIRPSSMVVPSVSDSHPSEVVISPSDDNSSPTSGKGLLSPTFGNYFPATRACDVAVLSPASLPAENIPPARQTDRRCCSL